MHPRLYMQSFQYATFNSQSGCIAFVTRHASGRYFHFTLSKEQFLALDDAIALIEISVSLSDCYGHYPLGQNTWLHYSDSEVRLYKYTRDSDRINFHFLNFREYKRYTHSRLKSFIRMKCEKDGRVSRSCRYEDLSTTTHQRPLSSTLRQTHRPGATKRHCWRKRRATSRKAINAKLPPDEETRSVLSERHSANSRRSGSISSESSLCTNFSAPSSIRLVSSNDSVESE